MRTLLTALVLAPAALGLAACGSDESESAATVKQGQIVKVSGREYTFTPTNVTVEGGGGPIQFDFENAGALAHNLRIEKDGKDLGGSNTFTPNNKESFRVNLQPGEYTMICTVGDHAQLGMKGKVTVK